ncbi:hypothetical protein TSUD_130320 [Trifolium subterraneum]|nr:hypothetical protein TSUD_130320 [Trifolium subterraneum]
MMARWGCLRHQDSSAAEVALECDRGCFLVRWKVTAKRLALRLLAISGGSSEVSWTTIQQLGVNGTCNLPFNIATFKFFGLTDT